MSPAMIESVLADLPPDEQELLLDAWQQMVEGWKFHRCHISRQGGHFLVEFPPGLGSADLLWSKQTIKKGRRRQTV